MQSEWRCPQCKSPRVTELNGVMVCLECGHNEPLEDSILPNALLNEPSVNYTIPEPEWSKKQWAYVQSLHAQIVHTNNKLNELLDKKDKYLYDTIKNE